MVRSVWRSHAETERVVDVGGQDVVELLEVLNAEEHQVEMIS